jgi:outer membrane protein
MRKSAVALIMMVLTGALISGAWAELKMGYINSAVILAEYEGTKVAEQKMQKEYAKWEQEATERQKEMQTLKDQMEKQSLLLSDERKKEIQAQLETKMADYQKFLGEKFGQQGEYGKKYEELTKPIVERINKIIEQIAKTDNYDFIFDVQNGGLIWAKQAYDLTSRVLQVLSAEK